jgi:hypothetical protein
MKNWSYLMSMDTQMLLAALAAKSGSSSDQAIQSLMAQVGLSPDGSSSLTKEDLIAKLSENNPALALLAQQMSQSKEDPVDEDDELSDSEDEIELSYKRVQAAKNLRKKFDAMYEELYWHREKNDVLAAALGACYLCWGDDPQCEVCGGDGRPGAFEPDRKSFADIVIPAVKRLGKRSSRSSQNKEIQYPKTATLPSQDIQVS